MDLFPLIDELTALHGPQGHEHPVADYLVERWSRSCSEVTTTPVGNVLAHLGGDGPRLLLNAHMDEINMIVKSISPEGFVWLANCHRGTGTFHLRECLNLPAVIMTRRGPVRGLFASVTGHLRFGRDGQDCPVGWDDVYVDLGLSSRAEAEELGIHPGCPIVYDVRARRVGHHVAMKAADARIGLVIMTALAETLDPAELGYDVYLLATIQEEGGLLGAASAASDLGRFDAALVYEVGLAGDIPTVDEKDMPVRLGSGPCIIYKDSSVHYNLDLIYRLEDTAAEHGMPVQRVVFQGFGSDGSEFIRQGIPTAMLAPPTRYSHSSYEMLNLDDVQGCIDLTQAFLRRRGGS